MKYSVIHVYLCHYYSWPYEAVPLVRTTVNRENNRREEREGEGERKRERERESENENATK